MEILKFPSNLLAMEIECAMAEQMEILYVLSPKGRKDNRELFKIPKSNCRRSIRL